ncbi:hypothetical protein G3I40_37570 [Streptomyces sp. SID14478]|uniref:hypothetical protein n=1 Tax=Streptomyces sp. SID14478 TaxID=2706073 RepID=UPI0013DF85A1|nr:hypothetical protein [Streptomyces sp. SID14478]NEB80880.1 hypothetical protein [Streptomyces sp. SID14478]
MAAVPATAASAGPLICELGHYSVKWDFPKHPWKITHVKGYEKQYSGGARKVTRHTEHVATASSGMTFTSSVNANFSVGKVLGSLDAQFSGEYRHDKSHSETRSLTVEDTLAKKGRYFFYVGRRQASGYWTGYYCDGGRSLIKKATGQAKTYSIRVDGAVRCGESVSRKALAYKVKQKYC